MPRSEYKYPGLRYDDCDLIHPRTKYYNRQGVHRETRKVIDDVYTDIIDLGPAFYECPTDTFLREIGEID